MLERCKTDEDTRSTGGAGAFEEKRHVARRTPANTLAIVAHGSCTLDLGALLNLMPI